MHLKTNSILETGRIRLRPPTEGDFEIYRDFYADREASHHYGGPILPHKAWAVLASDIGHWQLRGFGRWAIEEKSTRRMVGCCGLWAPLGWPRRELTWWLLRDARGCGIATEASKSVIAYAYDVLKWSLVETHINDENEAALKLTLRLGGIKISRETFPDGIVRSVYRLPKA